jgi:CRISPR-associated endonuclease Cas1/group II intron reverse transcriptase/maturase
MFTTPIDQLATPEKLMEALLSIRSKAVGIDKESLRRYREDPRLLEALSQELRNGRYVPEPMQRVELPKSDGTTRPIALASAKDKIVQKLLALHLGPYFDPLFSDKSYGYRPGKGTLRAIRRVQDYLRRGYRYAFRSDVEDFFETIPHEKLLELLSRHIADGRILSAISAMLANGSFHKTEWLEHEGGVHQGDALSPLLSNVYLDQMDRWLEERNVAFVRFADDFVLLFKNKNSQKDLPPKLAEYLETLGLRLGEEKSYAASVAEGFDFLGVRFRGEQTLIDNDRLQKKVSKLYEMAGEEWSLDLYLDNVALFVEGLQRYYLQIIAPESPQYAHLEHALFDSAARRFAREFESGRLRYKKELLPYAQRLSPLMRLKPSERKKLAKSLVDRAKSMAKDSPVPSEGETSQNAALGKKRERYAREMAARSVLVVEEFGSYLGYSRRQITLKHKGKVVRKVPAASCERIVVQTRGASLSTALIRQCSKRKIPIDFIDEYLKAPYASLFTERQAYAPRMLRQMERYADETMRLATARDFVRAKIKNQRNYLKYLDKHHRQVEGQIETLGRYAKTLKQARSVAELMGMEGSASAAYWEALKTIVEDKLPFPGRVTQDATDPINSALNYGYAILYGEVRHALSLAGLGLHISYLHVIDEGKPTLVFDFIEAFRSFVVDRTVFSMVNREEPLRTDAKGLLSKKSRRLVARNVLERLGAHTRHDGELRRMRTVIREEAYAFARAIDAGERYRPFIGRY